MGGGNNTTTANTRQTYKPAGRGDMEDVSARAAQVSQLPYTSITQGVAGLTPEQQAAMAAVGNAWNQSSPYLLSAAQHFENASQPLTAAQINQFYNPYASAVMGNLNEVFGQQQRDTTGQLTSAAGGVGADRIAVGQSELARQQGLAAGQTMAGIYQSALQAAQNQQGIEQASAYGLGNLSQAELNSILAGNQAYFGMGSASQATNQAGLNAIYNEQLARAGYPFQTAAFEAGIRLPAAGAMGGTTTGTQTTTPPSPNPWSQIAGLGIAALGAFSDPALKEDKVKVGKLDDGTPIYRFRYRGDPRTQIGLMADDVEEKHPEAVSGESPFRMVNYDLATRNAVHREDGGYVVDQAHKQDLGGAQSWPTIRGLNQAARDSFADRAAGRVTDIPKSYAAGGAPYGGGGAPYAGGSGGYVPSLAMPQMQTPVMPQLNFLSAPTGGTAGMGSMTGADYMNAGKGANKLWDDLFSVGSPETNMGWSTNVSPSGTGGWSNFFGNLFRRGGRTKSESFKVLEKIARGGEVDSNKDAKGDKSAPFYDEQFLAYPGTYEGAAQDMAAGRVTDIPKRKGGGEVEGYAMGGTPYGLPLDPFAFDPAKVYTSPYSVPSKVFTDRLDPNAPLPTGQGTPSPIAKYAGETVATKTPMAPRSESVQAKLLDKFISDPGERVSPTQGFAAINGAPEGMFIPEGLSPFQFQDIEAPAKDYKTYDAESGYSPWTAGGKPLEPTFDRQAVADKWAAVDKAGAERVPGGAEVPPTPQGDIDGAVPLGGKEGSTTVGMDGSGGTTAPFEGSGGTTSPFSGGSWSDRVRSAYSDTPTYSRIKGWSGKPISNTRLALMAAGLGMMGGESPHFGVNIGQGGLKGVAALKEFQQLDAQAQAQMFNNMLEAGRLDVAERTADVNAADKLTDNIRQVQQGAFMGYYDRDAAQHTINQMINEYKSAGLIGSDYVPPSPPKPMEIKDAPEAVYPEGMDPDVAVSIKPTLDGLGDTAKYTRGWGNQSSKASLDETKRLKKETAEAKAGAEGVLSTAYETNAYLDKQNPTGLLTPGSFHAERTALARMVDTIGRATGYNMGDITAQIGNAEALQKLQTYAGFGLARTLGTREAMQVIQQALAAVAGGQMTPAGAKNIIYSVIAAQSRHIDKYNFMNGWQAQNEKSSLVGSDTYFDDKVGQLEKYTRRLEILKRLDAARQKVKDDPEALERLKQESISRYGIDPSMWGAL